MHIPGHTAGSLLFYNESEKFVIAGDVLFDGSIGRTDLPGGNYDSLINGIKEKLFKLDDDTIVYPGHGKSTTIGKEKTLKPFFNVTLMFKNCFFLMIIINSNTKEMINFALGKTKSFN